MLIRYDIDPPNDMADCCCDMNDISFPDYKPERLYLILKRRNESLPTPDPRVIYETSE